MKFYISHNVSVEKYWVVKVVCSLTAEPYFSECCKS